MWNPGRIVAFLLALGMLGVLGQRGESQPAASSLPPPPDALYVQPGVEVLTRGPVHEAFAEALVTQPQATPLIPRQPPPTVEEMPAEQKPVGELVQWIPGYWAWDDDRLDFVWVSGFWRAPPPGRQWVPGHWHPVGASWQWVPGLWAPLEHQAVLNYLPAPPPVLEAPPSVPAPGPKYTFVSGTWVYQGNRYAWRPGYWVPHDPNWIWVPAHYVWTPGGYLFVEGYWDYPLQQRGLLFTPVALDIRFCTRPTFVYQPRYVVHDDCLYGALFLRPAHRHYYFGDYFEARYQGQGYTAWFDIRFGGAHDPLFGYYRMQQRDQRVWEHDLRELYAARLAGTAPRPPRTLVQQNTIANNVAVNNTTVNNVQQVKMVAPINQVNRPDLKLQALAPTAQLTEKKAAQQLADVSRERRHLESNLAPVGKAPPKLGQPAAKAVTLTLPKSAPTGIATGKAPPPLPTQPVKPPELKTVRPIVPPAPTAIGSTASPGKPAQPPVTGASTSPQPKLLQPLIKGSAPVTAPKRPAATPAEKKPADNKDKNTKQGGAT